MPATLPDVTSRPRLDRRGWMGTRRPSHRAPGEPPRIWFGMCCVRPHGTPQGGRCAPRPRGLSLSAFRQSSRWMRKPLPLFGMAGFRGPFAGATSSSLPPFRRFQRPFSTASCRRPRRRLLQFLRPPRPRRRRRLIRRRRLRLRLRRRPSGSRRRRLLPLPPCLLWLPHSPLGHPWGAFRCSTASPLSR